MIKYLIFITAASSLSFAKDLGCLGFPSAANFTCENTWPDGSTIMIVVDIPEGSACNQPPETGSIVMDDYETVVYKPSVRFDDKGDAHISFSFFNPNNKQFVFYCTNVKNITSQSPPQ